LVYESETTRHLCNFLAKFWTVPLYRFVDPGVGGGPAYPELTDKRLDNLRPVHGAKQNNRPGNLPPPDSLIREIQPPPGNAVKDEGDRPPLIRV
jgi:hypothetical protein